MKRLTALLSIALCLIIGGVYASWLYAGSSVTTPGTITQHFTIDEKTESGDAGSIKNSSNTLALKAENKGGDDTTSDEYYTVQFTNSGSIVFTFTPSQGAAAIYANGVPMKMTITVGAASYTAGDSDASNDVTVLRIKDEIKDTTDTDTGRTRTYIYTPAVGSSVSTINGEKQLGTYTKVDETETTPLHYTWTITSEELISLLVFCDDRTIVLDTAHKHELFQGNLAGSHINLLVEPNVSTQNN